jgi:hypothetical protein
MSKTIKICKGPGCKAWKSINMASKIRGLKGFKGICLVSCMDKCGGGVSVKLEDNDEVIKLRNLDEIKYLIDSSDGVLVSAC